MKLKLDDAGNVVVADGKPVYVFDDGKEAPFDVPDMYGKLARDGRRNSELQKALEASDVRIKAFDGLDDPEAARKALETVQNLKAGDLVKAGKVEEIRAEAAKAAEERVAAASKKYAEDLAVTQKERDELRTSLYDEKIGGSFSRSKFIAEKIAVPTDLLQAQFGRNFKIEDGKIVARDAAGNPIYSRAKPGEIAEFDEALETIVNSYAHKDMILKGTGSSGSGARPTNGGGAGPRSIPRSEYEKMQPFQRMAVAQEAAKGQVQIVDQP